MAGSIRHIINGGIYRGFALLENRRDDVEAIEELAFVILATTDEVQRQTALADFYEMCAGKKPFPAWWRPEFEPDGDHLPPQRRRNKEA